MCVCVGVAPSPLVFSLGSHGLSDEYLHHFGSDNGIEHNCHSHI